MCVNWISESLSLWRDRSSHGSQNGHPFLSARPRHALCLHRSRCHGRLRHCLLQLACTKFIRKCLWLIDGRRHRRGGTLIWTAPARVCLLKTPWSIWASCNPNSRISESTCCRDRKCNRGGGSMARRFTPRHEPTSVQAGSFARLLALRGVRSASPGAARPRMA